MIYAKEGSNEQVISNKPLQGYIQMQTERPTADSVAQQDGTWSDKPYTEAELYADTMIFLYDIHVGQTNSIEMTSFNEAKDTNTLAKDNVDWMNAVWASYYQKKALLPAKYDIDYPTKPHTYSEVFNG